MMIKQFKLHHHQEAQVFHLWGILHFDLNHVKNIL